MQLRVCSKDMSCHHHASGTCARRATIRRHHTYNTARPLTGKFGSGTAVQVLGPTAWHYVQKLKAPSLASSYRGTSGRKYRHAELRRTTALPNLAIDGISALEHHRTESLGLDKSDEASRERCRRAALSIPRLPLPAGVPLTLHNVPPTISCA